jgi:hypothetical protein
MTFLMAQANFEPTFSCINTLTILKPSYYSYLPVYEDETDSVFGNVGIQNSDAGELPRRKHTKIIHLSFSYLMCWIQLEGNYVSITRNTTKLNKNNNNKRILI